MHNHAGWSGRTLLADLRGPGMEPSGSDCAPMRNVCLEVQAGFTLWMSAQILASQAATRGDARGRRRSDRAA